MYQYNSLHHRIYGNSGLNIEFASVNAGPLKFDPINYFYRYNTTGPDTLFTRTFYLTPEASNSGEVLVDVEVRWSSNGTTHRVTIQSRLFNIR